MANFHDNELWIYAGKILKCLSKTKNMGLRFYKNDNINNRGYVDGGWDHDLSGYEISWSCNKQKCNALAKTEAEYVAVAEANEEAVSLGKLLIIEQNQSNFAQCCDLFTQWYD